jgi:hypothetical protein
MGDRPKRRVIFAHGPDAEPMDKPTSEGDGFLSGGKQAKSITERVTAAKAARDRVEIPPGVGPAIAAPEVKALHVWPAGVVLIGSNPKDARSSAISINVGCRSPEWVNRLYHGFEYGTPAEGLGILAPDKRGVIILREILAWLQGAQDDDRSHASDAAEGAALREDGNDV